MKVGITVVAALILAGTAAATQPGWTGRDAQAAARALAYPKPHARKVVCRGNVTFKCKAAYSRNRHKTFVLAPGTEGGWTCAGRTLHTCRVLPRGFLTSTQVTAMGGLLAAAGYSATGYIQEHFGVAAPQQAGSCNPSGASYLCAYSTPAVTVTIAYKHVKDGWLVGGST